VMVMANGGCSGGWLALVTSALRAVAVPRPVPRPVMA